MTEFPVVEAELTFLTEAEGGRSTSFPPDELKRKSYRPHIVLGDVNQREAIVEVVDGVKQITEKYLGVAFCDGPTKVIYGQPITVKMILMYYPNISYSEVIPGETFTLREGGRVVGFGTIKAKKLETISSHND